MSAYLFGQHLLSAPVMVDALLGIEEPKILPYLAPLYLTPLLAYIGPSRLGEGKNRIGKVVFFFFLIFFHFFFSFFLLAWV